MSKYYTIHTQKYGIDEALQKQLQALCRRYDKMKGELQDLYALSSPPFDAPVQGGFPSDTTQHKAVRAMNLRKNINAIDQSIEKSCEGEPGIMPILKNAVTHGFSYSKLGYVPECEEKFNARRRLFFYHLARELDEI